jgi:putative aldouronate transport system substrate-binding protein
MRYIVGDDPTYAKTDPTAPYPSAAWDENGTNLNLITSDATTQFITGAIDEAGWNAAVERWLSSGGEDVIAEYQAAYDAVNG